MPKQKLMAERQGIANGCFELRFGELPKDEATGRVALNITHDLCESFNDKLSQLIMSGGRRKTDLAQIKREFENHFHVVLPKNSTFDFYKEWDAWMEQIKTILSEGDTP